MRAAQSQTEACSAREPRCAQYTTCSPFAIKHVLDASLGDDGVVTLEPLVLVLPDEGGVMAALQRPLVVHHCKQAVPEQRREKGKRLHFSFYCTAFNATTNG